MTRPQYRVVVIVAVALLALAPSCSDDAPATTTTTSTTMAPPPLSKDLAPTDILGRDGQFSAFLELVSAAGVASVLDVDQPRTILAPNTDAVTALGEGEIAELRADEAALGSLVQHHVLEDSVSYGDLVQGGNRDLTTLAGDTVAVVVDGGQVTIDGAPIVKSDIRTRNGFIHVLGGVLLPEAG